MGAIASRQTQEIWRTQRAFETLKRIYSIRGNYNNFHFHLQFLLPVLIVILFASSSLQSMYLCLDFPVPNLCERCKAINTIPGGGVFAGAGGLGANPSNQACDLLTRFSNPSVASFFYVARMYLQKSLFAAFDTSLKFNIAPQNEPSQKESSLPTIIFQGLC